MQVTGLCFSECARLSIVSRPRSYDGMVVVLRGRGDPGIIYDSEGKAIPLTLLHDMVSYAHDPRFEALPRLFIVDVCSGLETVLSGDVSQNKTSHGQKNLVSLHGNVHGLLSTAVLDVLTQNAHKKKRLASLATDIDLRRQEIYKKRGMQILVRDGIPRRERFRLSHIEKELNKKRTLQIRENHSNY